MKLTTDFRWLVCLLLWAGIVPTLAQQTRTFGTWRAYTNPNRGTAIASLGERYYAATTGGLLAYNRSTGEVQQYTTIEGLIDIDPTAIEVDPARGRVYLGFADGSINYFSDPNDIELLTDIRRNTTLPDKRINEMTIDGDRLYVATNFGLVVYDLNTLRPVADAAQFGQNPSNQPVLDVALYGGRIYLLLEGAGLYSIAQSFPNLRDPMAWQEEAATGNLPPGAKVRMIAASGFGLFAQTQNTVLQKENGSWSEYAPFAGRIGLIHATEEAVASTRIDNAIVRDAQGQEESFFIVGAITDLAFGAPGQYAVVSAFRGMYAYQGGGQVNRISVSAPGSNDCIRIAAGNGELYVAPRGYDRIFVPTPRRDGIYYYSHESGMWTNISATEDLPEEVNEGFARAFYDDRTSEAFIGSYGEGMVRLKGGILEEYYNCANSGLTSVGGFCNPSDKTRTRVSGIDRDLNGNLWVSIDRAIPPLVVQTPEGEWFEVAADQFPTNPEDNHITDLIVDQLGTVWMVNYNRNLWAYSSNGTPDDWQDGKLLTFLTGINQGGLPSDQVFAVAEDQEGFIWVGTAQGVSVIFDPFTVSRGQVVDGSEPIFGQRRLLENTSINAIAVDGGNRKWIGTNDGVYLVSENGDDVIQEFNTDNSPLISDQVTDVSIDPSTGEVYFATAKGLISYQGDAVAGNAQCEDVLVYPNPVFTDYGGDIAIRGMSEGSTVKITTVSGLLVTELESLGGLATWDGRDHRGRKVRSGVYLALISDRNGDSACTGKFVVIERGQ